MGKQWLKIKRRSKRLQKLREDDIKDNQWGSKTLFEELKLDTFTDESQLYFYKHISRGNGKSDFIPRRGTIEDFQAWLFPACLDEGFADTTYAVEDIYDEQDSSDILYSYIWREGDSDFVLYTCDLDGSVNPSINLDVIPPLENISSDTTLTEVRYYRITGGTTFTITDANSVFETDAPFSMTIKNASGSTITINRSSSDTFYSTGGTVTTFNLADGESVNLIAISTSGWDLT
jgi:hypothetical protein